MHRTALQHLKRADPVMAKVIAEVGPCRFQLGPQAIDVGGDDGRVAFDHPW